MKSSSSSPTSAITASARCQKRSTARRHTTQRDALEHCLEKLPQPQRELVLTAYTKGTRMDDLASRRGETAMAIYKKLHRIRQALLECVRRTLAQEEPI